MSHRCHVKKKVVGFADQLPAVAVSVSPPRSTPKIVGNDVFAGQSETGAAATAAVWSETAVAVPTAVVAVTDTRTVLPTSIHVAMYVCPVAVGTSVQVWPDASQRCH